MSILSTVGIELPDTFPVEPYEKIHAIVTAKKEKNENGWKEYAIAWNAIPYRYASLLKYNDRYAELVAGHGNSPSPEIRAEQEEAIFNFFMAGFSIIDTLGYAMYAIAGYANASRFPLTDEMKPNVNLVMVMEKFRAYFKNEKITSSMKGILESQEYGEWKVVRNILMHRGQPGRKIHAGGEENGVAEWITGIAVDENLLSGRLEWVSSAIGELMESLLDLASTL